MINHPKRYTRPAIAYSATMLGVAIWSLAVYSACTSATPGQVIRDGDNVPETCQRPARYTSLAEIEEHRIMLWEEYARVYGVTLSAAQQSKLETEGDLVGDLDLERPVKFPNGDIDTPEGWLAELPSDHPWVSPPPFYNATFPAWFEVRIADPLLYDPDLPDHVQWATAYLTAAADADEGLLTSLAGTDTGCP